MEHTSHITDQNLPTSLEGSLSTASGTNQESMPEDVSQNYIDLDEAYNLFDGEMVSGNVADQDQSISEEADQGFSHRARRIGTVALTGTIVGLAAASWVFQVGPWNEGFRVDQATRVLEETLDPNAAAMTVTKITATVELVSATLIALGLNTGSKLTDWFKNRKKGKAMLDEVDASISSSEEQETNENKNGLVSQLGGVASDFGLSMAGGAGMVTLKHHRRAHKEGETEPRLAKDMAVSVAATVPVTAFSGFVAYTAAKGIITGGESDWPGSDFLVEYGTSNKFWMSLLVVGYGMKYGIGALKSHRNRTVAEQQTGEYVDQEVDVSASLFARPAIQEGEL